MVKRLCLSFPPLAADFVLEILLQGHNDREISSEIIT